LGGYEDKYKDKAIGSLGRSDVMLYRRRFYFIFSAWRIHTAKFGGKNGTFSNDAVDVIGRIGIYHDSLSDGFSGFDMEAQSLS
jgi:hypothetical protein